jgi:hypothetical protein
MIAMPGEIAIQGAISIKVRLSLSILPQEGLGGKIPKPRKLNAASVRIDQESARLT